MNNTVSPFVIHLVEDDPDLRNALTFALEVEGFRVRTYANAEEILSENELSASGCLVLDYKLPSMTGLALLSKLRERGCYLDAILITTHPSAAVRDFAAVERVRLIEKPLLTDELFNAIREVLARP